MLRVIRFATVIMLAGASLACLVGGLMVANTRLSMCGMGLIVAALLFAPRCEE